MQFICNRSYTSFTLFKAPLVMDYFRKICSSVLTVQLDLTETVQFSLLVTSRPMHAHPNDIPELCISPFISG